jgi:hypothetical protein
VKAIMVNADRNRGDRRKVDTAQAHDKYAAA